MNDTPSPSESVADDAAYIIDWVTRMTAGDNGEILHIAREWVETIEKAKPVKVEE